MKDRCQGKIKEVPPLDVFKELLASGVKLGARRAHGFQDVEPPHAKGGVDLRACLCARDVKWEWVGGQEERREVCEGTW